MPLYEYVCRACGTDFELLTSAGRRDSLDTTCPGCGAAKAARKISLMANPVVRGDAYAGGSDGGGMDCGAPGGCCGGMCAMDD